MKRKKDYWLREGKQSKKTLKIKKIVDKFNGDNLDKISQIIRWYHKNIKYSHDTKRNIKIFAKRGVSKIIKDGFSTGCHDDAAVLAALFRSIGIPAKYLVGIDRINPKNRGHCVVEINIEDRRILIEPEIDSIGLDPRKSSFYRHNFIMKEGLDSWDCGIKTFEDWKKLSLKAQRHINKLGCNKNNC
jgi:hypothetical protein